MRRFAVLLFALCAWAWCAEPVFNVRDFGAANDGSGPATEGFRAAIAAAKLAGGGTVYVPAGNYVTGPIELVSNLMLYIDAAAVVHFPATRLPFTPGREQGIECLTPVPLIGGRNLENVTIAGHGTLTTNNADWLKLMGRSQGSGNDPGSAFGAKWEALLQMLELKKPVPKEIYEEVAPELRPSFIRTMDSRNVHIEGLHFAGSSMWTIHLLYTDNASVRDVIIETYPGVHTDGIAVDSSRNVRISDCYIDTGDDGIVIKAGKDADGLRVNRPSENISISNCTVHRAHGAVTIGSETSGWVRNVTAGNVTCDGTQMGVRIKSSRTRGGGVEDVRFDNWTMRNVGTAVNVTNYYLMEGETRATAGPVTERTPRFRNIAVSNMTIDHARVAVDIEGLPEMPIEGLRISDVTGAAAIGVKAHNTAGLELHHVQVTADSGPTFLIRDSKELELDGVASRKLAAGMPMIRLDNCPGAVIRQSRALSGTETFLSVAPGELKRVTLEGNLLMGARKPLVESSKSFPMIPEKPTESEKNQ